MIIINKKTHINANIDHVYKYIGDVEFLYNELLKHKEKEELYDLTIKLNGVVLEFIDKHTLFTLTVMEPEAKYQFKALFTPVAYHLKRLGQGFFTCELSSDKADTNMLTVLESELTPGPVWAIFIKAIAFILLLKSHSYEKEFIKRIEQSA